CPATTLAGVARSTLPGGRGAPRRDVMFITMDAVRTVGRRALIVDALLAAAVGALVLAGVHGAGSWEGPGFRPMDAAGSALALLASAALAGRRVWPLPVLGGTVVAAGGYLLAGDPYSPIGPPAVVARCTARR